MINFQKEVKPIVENPLFSYLQYFQSARNDLRMRLRAALYYVNALMMGLCFSFNPRDLFSLT